MTFERRANLAQCHEPVAWEVAALGQRGVEGRGRMTFAHNKAVAVGPTRIFWVVLHDTARVESREDLNRRKRRRRMAGTGLGGHAHDVAAHLASECFKPLQVCHNSPE